MRVVVGDLEANGFLHVATHVHCGVFKDLLTKQIWKFKPDQIQEMLTFLDTVDVLIMHNGLGYDLPLLKKLYGYVYKGKKVDTLVMSRLLNPKRLRPFNCPNTKCGPHSLEAWGYRVGRGKVEHEDWETYTPEMLHRCAEDVEITDLVYFELLKEGKPYEWKKAQMMSFALFDTLHKQEEHGWLVDRQWMDKSISMLTHMIGRIDRALDKHLPIILIPEKHPKGVYGYVKKPFVQSGAKSAIHLKWLATTDYEEEDNIVGGPFSRITWRQTDLNKDKETKSFLLNLGWIPAEYNYNDDGDRTSPKLSKDDPFEGITGALGRLVSRRVQCRQRRSIMEGWINLIREDGRIASVINNLAVTGRATHRGIVNVPGGKSFFGKWMRKVFICQPGWKLVGTDSDACQIRMLSARMGDAEYQEVILNGKKELGTDMHTINMNAAGLDNRDQAKTFFYGFLFGAGDAKVGRIVKGSSADGKRLKTNFMAGLPALGRLMDRLTEEWKSKAKKRKGKWGWEFYNGWIKGLDGRPIFIPSEHMILVYMLQSDEAIMMSAAYIKTEKDLLKAGYKWGRDFGIVCFYHDEYTIECREEIAEEVGRIGAEAIAWAGRFFGIKCPHIGDPKIGINWWQIH